MIEPTEQDIGRKVVYRVYSATAPAHAPRIIDREEGVITSFNPSYVFVRYGSKAHSQATKRTDLDWIS